MYEQALFDDDALEVAPMSSSLWWVISDSFDNQYIITSKYKTRICEKEIFLLFQERKQKKKSSLFLM